MLFNCDLVEVVKPRLNDLVHENAAGTFQAREDIGAIDLLDLGTIPRHRHILYPDIIPIASFNPYGWLVQDVLFNDSSSELDDQLGLGLTTSSHGRARTDRDSCLLATSQFPLGPVGRPSTALSGLPNLRSTTVMLS